MPKIRLGIIGAGGRGIGTFGTLFSKVFAGETQVVALADPNRERADAGLSRLGDKADIHENPRDLLDRKDIDAVVITTPDYLHEQYSVAAFQRGKHVLVDKPLATSGQGCLHVIEASKKADKLLYMGFNLRHAPVLQHLKKLVDAGTFGAIFSIQAMEYYNGGRTYMSRWNRLKKFSGGLFIHKGSHDFDIINWMMGKARPAQVCCFANVFTLHEKGLPFKPRKGAKPGPTCTACAYRKECPDGIPRAAPGRAPVPEGQRPLFDENTARLDGYHKDLCMYLSDKDTHDQGIAIVEYDNGATASLSEYFVTPKSNRHYLIEGTRGHGEADLSQNRIEVMPRWSQDTVTYNVRIPTGGHGGADPRMCADFIACLQKRLRPTASGVDGAWSVAIGEACERSRAEKRVVKISEVLDVKSPLLKK